MALVSREEFVAEFDNLYAEVMSELVPQFEMPPQAVNWVSVLLKHNVPGGKMNRGLTVVHTLQAIKGEITATEKKEAIILGWCIEWLQAYFLVADDLMDQSITRRGQPCWYLCPKPLEGANGEKVGTIACNDFLILESIIYRVLRTHFRKASFYADLLDLFHEVSYQTELGQLLDLTSQPSTQVNNLDLFTLERYKLIVKYKTAFYSFYMPVALAMMMAGLYNDAALDTARSILLPMGEYFQVQDDYLDCYGSPEVIGKVGRDIEENKCGWLVVQALKRCSAEQRQILEENYGKDDAEKVAKVKALYLQLDLPAIFREYEEESYQALRQIIDQAQGVPKAVFEQLLEKIYKRSI